MVEWSRALDIISVSLNPVEGRTKICQLKDLILTLFGLIYRRIYIYIYGVDVVEWSRALDVRLSDWCCSASIV